MKKNIKKYIKNYFTYILIIIIIIIIIEEEDNLK
jgi:hypothetical protein